jgi:hypothetical protein
MIIKSYIQNTQDMRNLFRLGFLFHIGLDGTNSNSYKHKLYIYKPVQKKPSIIRYLKRDGQKKWIDEKRPEILPLYY